MTKDRKRFIMDLAIITWRTILSLFTIWMTLEINYQHSLYRDNTDRINAIADTIFRFSQ
jgi:hypothetical protein